MKNVFGCAAKYRTGSRSIALVLTLLASHTARAADGFAPPAVEIHWPAFLAR